MIAAAAIDMTIWDALARAAGMSLAVLLGGALGKVPAYNSNGLWLRDVAPLADEAAELVKEGGFTGLKLRLGRDKLADDLAAIRTVRDAAGNDISYPFFSIAVCYAPALEMANRHTWATRREAMLRPMTLSSWQFGEISLEARKELSDRQRCGALPNSPGPRRESRWSLRHELSSRSDQWSLLL
jgi:hypothetical protein